MACRQGQRQTRRQGWRQACHQGVFWWWRWGHRLATSSAALTSSRPSISLPLPHVYAVSPSLIPPPPHPTSPPSPWRSVLVARGALPGSNGSDSRANALAAGLIVVVTGNYLLIILAALHDTREPSAATHGSDKDLA